MSPAAEGDILEQMAWRARGMSGDRGPAKSRDGPR